VRIIVVVVVAVCALCTKQSLLLLLPFAHTSQNMTTFANMLGRCHEIRSWKGSLMILSFLLFLTANSAPSTSCFRSIRSVGRTLIAIHHVPINATQTGGTLGRECFSVLNPHQGLHHHELLRSGHLRMAFTAGPAPVGSGSRRSARRCTHHQPITSPISTII